MKHIHRRYVWTAKMRRGGTAGKPGRITPVKLEKAVGGATSRMLLQPSAVKRGTEEMERGHIKQNQTIAGHRGADPT